MERRRGERRKKKGIKMREWEALAFQGGVRRSRVECK